MANYTDYFLDEASEVNRGQECTAFGYTTTEFEVGNDPVRGTCKGAFRFKNIAISQNTNVSDAQLRIKVTSKGGGGGNIKYKIYGIKETNTGNFNSNPFGRAKTTAFDTVDSSLPGTGGYHAVEVRDQVNEIFAQGGWSSGNALGFFLEDNGSASDVWMYNTTPGEDEAVLSLRAAALPDFTPGPYLQRVGRPPAATSFGVRISKRGVDALTENIQNLNVFSKHNILKAVRDAEKGWPSGSNLEKVSHGLKYSPAFMTFYKISGKVSHANTANATSGIPYVQTYSTQETVEMLLDPNASDPNSWYYYVFIDENI